MLITGYPRSGSTLLGALLNAHPEMVIAQEADLLTHTSPKTTPGEVLSRLLIADRDMRRRRYRWSGYSYRVANQWQGRYARLPVIGDKDSTGNTRNLSNRPDLLGLLRDALGWRVRNLFVYRNPYDMAATVHLAMLRHAGRSASLRRNVPLSEFAPKPGEEPPVSASSVAHILAWSDRLVDVLPMFSEAETLAVRHEDLIASPKERLRHILAFLDVACSEDYLDACAATVFPQPHRTRNKVCWRQSQAQAIAEAIGKYPWFEGYSFRGE